MSTLSRSNKTDVMYVKTNYTCQLGALKPSAWRFRRYYHPTW